jgi:opacity protein-like surface antigen
MRRIAVFTILTGIALGAATPALADGEPAAASAPVAVKDGWSGLYIGAGGGAGRIERSGTNDAHVWQEKEKCKKHDVKDIDFDKHWNVTDVDCGYNDEKWKHLKYGSFDKTFLGPFSGDDWEGFGTIQIGYDRLVHDRLLIGAFADVDIYAGSGDESKSKFVKDSFELNNTVNVGGKLGFLLTPKFLLYGVGGYTQASIDKSVSFKYGPTFDDFDRPKGWFAGGGAEYQFRPGLSLKLEYRFADYGDMSDSASYLSDPHYFEKHCDWYRKTYGADWKSDDELEVQTVRALLVFRPGEPDAPAPRK